MHISSRCAGVLFSILLLAGCADTSPTEVVELARPPVSSISAGPVLVECPTDVTRTVSKTIHPLSGGTIELDGHSLRVPALALLLPTKFTLTVPASRFVEVHIKANGEHGFEFLRTAGLTISYARCTRGNIDKSDLSVYKVDPESRALLKFMGGSDDMFQRRVTLLTDSLSAYAIAQ
jgi:hypothetical protein